MKRNRHYCWWKVLRIHTGIVPPADTSPQEFSRQTVHRHHHGNRNSRPGYPAKASGSLRMHPPSRQGANRRKYKRTGLRRGVLKGHIYW